MSLDTELTAQLKARLTELIDDAKDKLPGALPFEQYQQSCGMVEAWTQVRDRMIPEIVEKLQRS